MGVEYLKANVLRIGNPSNKDTWVIGNVVSISALDTDFEQLEVETEEDFTWFFKDNYFGISLNEEWILKFGIGKENGYPFKFLNGFLKMRNGFYFLNITT